mmetsp:Transcript_17180/g.48758  ORF Transcript_17180/g.48758 Transcript_17180/m.48758 type:complete len:89 (-) Transcript_17180:920-1186(-)
MRLPSACRNCPLGDTSDLSLGRCRPTAPPTRSTTLPASMSTGGLSFIVGGGHRIDRSELPLARLLGQQQGMVHWVGGVGGCIGAKLHP